MCDADAAGASKIKGRRAIVPTAYSRAKEATTINALKQNCIDIERITCSPLGFCS